MGNAAAKPRTTPRANNKNGKNATTRKVRKEGLGRLIGNNDVDFMHVDAPDGVSAKKKRHVLGVRELLKVMEKEMSNDDVVNCYVSVQRHHYIMPVATELGGGSAAGFSTNVEAPTYVFDETAKEWKGERTNDLNYAGKLVKFNPNKHGVGDDDVFDSWPNTMPLDEGAESKLKELELSDDDKASLEPYLQAFARKNPTLDLQIAVRVFVLKNPAPRYCIDGAKLVGTKAVCNIGNDNRPVFPSSFGYQPSDTEASEGNDITNYMVGVEPSRPTKIKIEQDGKEEVWQKLPFAVAVQKDVFQQTYKKLDKFPDVKLKWTHSNLSKHKTRTVFH